MSFPPVYIRFDPREPHCVGGYLSKRGNPELFTSKAQVAERIAGLKRDWPNGKLFRLWHLEVVAAETTTDVVRITDKEMRPRWKP